MSRPNEAKLSYIETYQDSVESGTNKDDASRAETTKEKWHHCHNKIQVYKLQLASITMELWDFHSDQRKMLFL